MKNKIVWIIYYIFSFLKAIIKEILFRFNHFYDNTKEIIKKFYLGFIAILTIIRKQFYKHFKIIVIVIMFLSFISILFFSGKPYDLPFDTYLFEITSSEQKGYIRDYSFFYNFSESHGNINFRTSPNISTIYIEFPEHLQINNYSLIDEPTKRSLRLSEVGAENKGSYFYINHLENSTLVLLEITSYNKSFYPNGVFMFRNMIIDITPTESEEREVLIFDLGGYRCDGSFFVPIRLDTEGITPNCNQKDLRVFISTEAESKNLSGINKFILNTYDFGKEKHYAMFINISIAFFVGTLLLILDIFLLRKEKKS